MTILPLPLSFFVTNLERQRPFSFARYGDGEWQCILGVEGKNCDGVVYSPELAGALAGTLTARGDYFYAMGPKASRSQALGPRVERWLLQKAPGVVWYNSESLLDASLKGELYPFVQALKSRKVMLVGSSDLKKLPVLKPTIHVVPPTTEAFAHMETVKRYILERAARVDVILFSAGPAAKIMLNHLHATLKATHTLIDIGSLFDMYCGKDSRKYARNMSPEEKQLLLERNFYE